MHKCSRCGQEFEGQFCPNCGTVWQNTKICPDCHTTLFEYVRFCPVCGHSFISGTPYTQPQAAAKNTRSKNAGAWIKSHLKLVIFSIIGLIVLITLLSLIPTFIAIPSNGTYYESYGGKLDEDSYITLKNYKWTDDEGSSGKYKLSGSKIKVYISMFGETDVYSGTVKNGVLRLDTDDDGEMDETYVSKNHKHKFGNWKTDYEATCTSTGKATHVCDCGYKDSTEIPLAPHTGDWITEDGWHWKICSVCGEEFEKGECDSEYHCSICEFSAFKFILRSNNTYEISGFDKAINCDDLVIPESYKNLPVTAIGKYAFESCTELTSITIPKSINSIGVDAFRRCRGLTSISVNEGNTVYHSKNNCIIQTTFKILVAGCKNSIIPDDGSVTTICYNAFSGCTGLTSITIPKSVTYIDNDAFSGCTGLTSITIPKSVTYIGMYAFEYCTNISEIKFTGTMEEWRAIQKDDYWNAYLKNYTVICNNGNIAEYGDIDPTEPI